jgi:hypothetical protein
MPEEEKEIRNATLGVKVTPRERTAASFVAGWKGMDVSNLLRTMSLDEVLAEAERLREAAPAA